MDGYTNRNRRRKGKERERDDFNDDEFGKVITSQEIWNGIGFTQGPVLLEMDGF
jgi:hypothetical protein